MKNNTLAIIEIGSNNTKLHVYCNNQTVYETNTTIELKKHYQEGKKISSNDLEELGNIIAKALEFTDNVHVYGCSIFRNITENELKEINQKMQEKFHLEIEVVSQEDEAHFTALGCYNNIEYDGNICVFIGGGGSIELLLINDKKVVDKKYFDFGVVDITKTFPSLKDDIPTCTFDEVFHYVKKLIGDLEFQADVLVLTGGDHFYWYNNAGYKLDKNTLYQSENQKYMITRDMSDEYDHDAYQTSLDKIRENSDNPKWFDGCRAMKTITNLISHEINAQYIVPTKINMEDGIKASLEE